MGYIWDKMDLELYDIIYNSKESSISWKEYADFTMVLQKFS